MELLIGLTIGLVFALFLFRPAKEIKQDIQTKIVLDKKVIVQQNDTQPYETMPLEELLLTIKKQPQKLDQDGLLIDDEIKQLEKQIRAVKSGLRRR